MHNQIRVAADGRGEVRITGARQRKVALVLLRITSLLERPQHQVRKNALLRLAGNLAHEPLVHLRRHRDALRYLMGLRGAAIAAPRRTPLRLPPIRLHGELFHWQRADAQRLSKRRGGLLKVYNPLRIRHLVDAINGWDLLGGKPRRDAFIGAEHELFDQAMRPAPLRAHDRLHVAVRIELHYWLRQIEVDRATPHPLPIQPQRQVQHPIDGRRQQRLLQLNALALGLVLRCGRRRDLATRIPPSRLRRGVQAMLHACVGHTPRAADDPLRHAVAENLATTVDLHDTAQDKAILVRQKGTHAARKLMRQHGHGPVREVHAGAAHPGLGIQRRARKYVVADVRNVHLQFRVAVLERPDDHGIVKITCRLSIDRHNGEIPKMLALGQFLACRHLDGLPGALFCLRQDVRWKGVRDAVLPNHDLHIDAKGVRRPENLQNTTDRRSSRLDKAGDLDLHGQPFQRPTFVALQNTVCPTFSGALGVREPGPTRQGVVSQRPMRRGHALRHNLRSGRDLDGTAQPIVPGLDKITLGQIDESSLRAAFRAS